MFLYVGATSQLKVHTCEHTNKRGRRRAQALVCCVFSGELHSSSRGAHHSHLLLLWEQRRSAQGGDRWISGLSGSAEETLAISSSSDSIQGVLVLMVLSLSVLQDVTLPSLPAVVVFKDGTFFTFNGKELFSKPSDTWGAGDP